jgi:hypothetical protein
VNLLEATIGEFVKAIPEDMVGVQAPVDVKTEPELIHEHVCNP